MKNLLVLSLTLCLAACNAQTQEKIPPTLESLQGQWVVINYWARWCKPCIEEIPELNALNATYDAVTVLGVNYDGARGEELRAQAIELGVEFDLLEEDPAADIGVPRPVVLPTTLIIGPEGVHHSTLVGPQTLNALAQATGQLAPDEE